jgi:hypothetical protein
MKKVFTLLFCLMVGATVAFAGIGVTWSTLSYGVAWHGASAAEITISGYAAPHTAGESLLDRYSAIWQLIYDGGDGIDPAVTTGDYTSGNDQLLAQRIIPLGGGAATESADYNPLGVNTPGTSWDNWMSQNNFVSTTYEDLTWVAAGSVYMRIFEDTPAAGSWYYQTGLETLITTYAGAPAVPPNTPTAGTMDFDTGEGLLARPNMQFAPPVPEPATMGLLGLGALVMAIRRRRS